MTPPEDIKNEFIGKWIAKAEEDFDLARYLLETRKSFLNAIGFHAQQAAEKYLKAYLVFVQVDFPKTHSIERLLTIVAASNSELAGSLDGAVALTDYGVEVRYPGELPALSLEQAQHAVKLAGAVRKAVLRALERTGENADGISNEIPDER